MQTLCNVDVINRVVPVVVMTDAVLHFFQFLVNNMVVCGQTFWWIWENENYEDEMSIENDFSFTCFPLVFLPFDKIWMILNRSLTAEFFGLKFVLINVLNSFAKLKVQCLILVSHVIGFDHMHSRVSKK